MKGIGFILEKKRLRGDSDIFKYRKGFGGALTSLSMCREADEK